MRNFFTSSFALLLIATLALTVALPSDVSAQKRSDQPTIAEAASGLPQFSTLVSLLGVAGLVELVDGKQHFTVFAPTNTAFSNLETAYPGVSKCLTSSDNVKLLQGVLAYHVTRGDRNSQSLFPAKNVKMLNGANATTSFDDGPMIAGANIIDPFDVRVSNGVIHAIDTVIVDNATLTMIESTCFPS